MPYVELCVVIDDAELLNLVIDGDQLAGKKQIEDKSGSSGKM